ncbi:hypothetical protein SAMN05519104_7963 [Rhizobiales bacterium GAS188]|nr:hypothetical protein SAMN05519104_7963 [Rhizobiales bacterium GAS188]
MSLGACSRYCRRPEDFARIPSEPCRGHAIHPLPRRPEERSLVPTTSKSPSPLKSSSRRRIATIWPMFYVRQSFVNHATSGERSCNITRSIAPPVWGSRMSGYRSLTRILQIGDGQRRAPRLPEADRRDRPPQRRSRGQPRRFALSPQQSGLASASRVLLSVRRPHGGRRTPLLQAYHDRRLLGMSGIMSEAETPPDPDASSSGECQNAAQGTSQLAPLVVTLYN